MSEPSGHKTALEIALAAWEEGHAENQPRDPQGDLFGEAIAAQHGAAPGTAVATRGPGRPPGARNRRTDTLVDFYISRHYAGRDPLDMTLSVATLPILAPGVLEALAHRLGVSRHDAAKFWLSSQSAVLPYVHQRQSAIEIRPPGAPGSGNPIEWGFSEAGLIDVTHSGSADGE